MPRRGSAMPASRWDCHTPYPVHGLDRAMGLKPSPMPYICLTAGFIGARRGAAHAVVDERRRLSGERRRQAAVQLAGLRADHLRAVRAVRGPGDMGASSCSAGSDAGIRRCTIRVMGEVTSTALPWCSTPTDEQVQPRGGRRRCWQKPAAQDIRPLHETIPAERGGLHRGG